MLIAFMIEDKGC